MPAPKPLLTREERGAKREARRAKQREENVGRAAKMHTARLVWEHNVHRQASAPAAQSEAQVHVGCSGWFYWHWRSDFYPDGLPTKDWFRHYSKQFGTVESGAKRVWAYFNNDRNGYAFKNARELRRQLSLKVHLSTAPIKNPNGF